MTTTPFPISGKVYDINESILYGAVVKLLNVNTREGINTTSNSSGEYVLDLANLTSGYSDNDVILIEATIEDPYRYDDRIIHVDTDIGSAEYDFWLAAPVGAERNSRSNTDVANLEHDEVTEAKRVKIIADNDKRLTSVIGYDGNKQEYIGEARPGTPKGEKGWRIRKQTFNASNFVTDVQWANGNTKFDKVWDNRTGYDYA